METIEIERKNGVGFIEKFGVIYCSPLDDWDTEVEIDVVFTMRDDLKAEFAKDLEKLVAKYAM